MADYVSDIHIDYRSSLNISFSLILFLVFTFIAFVRPIKSLFKPALTT